MIRGLESGVVVIEVVKLFFWLEVRVKYNWSDLVFLLEEFYS